jgi:hypothetical protein
MTDMVQMARKKHKTAYRTVVKTYEALDINAPVRDFYEAVLLKDKLRVFNHDLRQTFLFRFDRAKRVVFIGCVGTGKGNQYTAKCSLDEFKHVLANITGFNRDCKIWSAACATVNHTRVNHGVITVKDKQAVAEFML